MNDEQKRKSSKDFRRQRRKQATRSEGLLWSILRAKQLCGLKFRREHSIEHWIVDFACAEKMLVVEIDGGYHDATIEDDLNRQKDLERRGWSVLRYTDEDVENDAEVVGRAIAKELGLEYEFVKRSKRWIGDEEVAIPLPSLRSPLPKGG